MSHFARLNIKKIKPFFKSTPFYWHLKKLQNKRKYKQVRDFTITPSIAPNDKPRNVLIFTSVALFADHALVDQYIAGCCAAKNVNPIIVLCDERLPLCHASDRYSFLNSSSSFLLKLFQSRSCKNCQASSELLRKYSNFKVVMLSSASSIPTHKSGADYNNNINKSILESAKAGFIRFLATSEKKHVEHIGNQKIHELYKSSSFIAYSDILSLLQEYDPEFVVAHHGIYVPQGLVQLACKQNNTIFYSWHFGYRKGTLIFSKDDTYHKELVEPLDHNYLKPLNETKKSLIVEYLASRQSGKNDWIHFNRNPHNFLINTRKPILTCFTSVDWDAALHFPSSCFTSQFEFLENLIEIFKSLNEFQLFIRIHPAEITGFHPSHTKTSDFLQKLSLPNNVTLIDSNDKRSSYELAKQSTATIVYNTKMAIELAAMNIPVIVAGDAWIKQKGFSFDVFNMNDLRKYVVNFPDLKLSAAQHEMAYAYAYYFYFMRCIDIEGLESTGKKFSVSLNHSKINLDSSSSNSLLKIIELMLEKRAVVFDKY